MVGPLEKKAILTLGGDVRLPRDYRLPCRVSHSTAGPGAGSGSAVFEFDSLRVKKSISYDSGEFELIVNGDRPLSMDHNGEPFLDEVRIIPVVRHCPEQAFFNLDPRCMYRCAYCSSPLLDMDEDKHLSPERIMDMLAESMRDHEVRAVSLTSGVVGSPEQTVDRMVEVVRRIRSEYPGIPIGVEPYVSSVDHIRMLRDAGADEIKLNIETPRRDIFAKVCPDLDFDSILGLLEDAVEIFGRGRVMTNIIYGLGEVNSDLESMMDHLCSKGVIPGLRALRVNGLNRGALESAIGTPESVTMERAIDLARMQKSIMQRYGMSSLTSVTMCMECTCCDLVPFRDL